jgi:phenylpropionate dioxygenase-like ring-hydroxylating dioxygenase large terminal subunit
MISAPAVVAPRDADASDNHLHRIATSDWCGLLFINIDREALPLRDAMSGLADVADHFPLGSERFQTELTTELNCNWKTYIEHCLTTRHFAGADGGDWHWQWPTLILHFNASLVSVQQIIPRTFARTRVIEHLFSAAALDSNELVSAVEAAKQRAAIDKSAAERMQAQRESGEAASVDESRLASLHELLRLAHARQQ